MRDLDDLLDGDDITRAAGDAAQPPGYADVVRRGRQLRSHRHVAAAGAAAVAVLAVVGAAQLAGPAPTEGPQPAPAPSSPTTSPSEPTSEDPVPAEGHRVVDADDATPRDVAVDPGSPDRRAVVWQRDPGASAIAVTSDGFVTRTVHEFQDSVSVALLANGRFAAVSDTLPETIWILEDDGGRTPVDVDLAASPATNDETPVVTGGGHTLGVVAIDGATATAHRVPVPAEATQIVFSGGRLMAVAVDTSPDPGFRMLYRWSDDGGDTWHTVGTPTTGDVYTPAIGALPGEHVLVRDVLTTVSHLGGVLRGQDALVETEYHGDYAVVSDPFVWQGEVRMFGALDADGSEADEAGLYRFVGGRLERIPTNRPDVVDQSIDGMYPQRLVGASDGPDGPVLWLASPDGVLLRSIDGGESWEEHQAR